MTIISVLRAGLGPDPEQTHETGGRGLTGVRGLEGWGHPLSMECAERRGPLQLGSWQRGTAWASKLSVETLRHLA